MTVLRSLLGMAHGGGGGNYAATMVDVSDILIGNILLPMMTTQSAAAADRRLLSLSVSDDANVDPERQQAVPDITLYLPVRALAASCRNGRRVVMGASRRTLLGLGVESGIVDGLSPERALTRVFHLLTLERVAVRMASAEVLGRRLCLHLAAGLSTAEVPHGSPALHYRVRDQQLTCKVLDMLANDHRRRLVCITAKVDPLLVSFLGVPDGSQPLLPTFRSDEVRELFYKACWH